MIYFVDIIYIFDYRQLPDFDEKSSNLRKIVNVLTPWRRASACREKKRLVD